MICSLILRLHYDYIKISTNAQLERTTVTSTPTAPTPRDLSFALAIQDILVMESHALVR